MARSSNDSLVGGLPRQMISERSSDIQYFENSMASARSSDGLFVDHAMADARSSDIQYMENTMAGGRSSDVLYTREATTARFSDNQMPDLPHATRYSNVQVLGSPHGSLVISSHDTETRRSHTLKNTLRQQRVPISDSPDESPLRRTTESQQFESHSAGTNTVSGALALREILEALQEVCSVGLKAWWANFQLLTPINETDAVRVKDSYLESRHDLRTSVAYLSARGLSAASEPHIWIVANEFFRLCGELDSALKLQAQPAESTPLVINSMKALNKAVSRAKRLIEMSPWKGAAITFRFDKNIQASKDYHDGSTQSNGVLPINSLRRETSEATLVQLLLQALLEQCNSIEASLSLVKESVNHGRSDLSMDSMARIFILTVVSDCEDMRGSCTALQARLRLHGNEEALSRCSALWNLYDSFLIHLYECAFPTRDDSACFDQLSEAGAILKRFGTLAREIGKIMEHPTPFTYHPAPLVL